MDSSHILEKVPSSGTWYLLKTRARFFATQVAYSMHFCSYDECSMREYVDVLCNYFRIKNFDQGLLDTIIFGLMRYDKSMDSIIENSLDESWTIARINLVTLSITQTAISEFLYCENCSVNLVLSEYVDIGFRCLDKSSEVDFLNAMLSSVMSKISDIKNGSASLCLTQCS